MSFQTKMANQVKEIAQAAIDSINRLTSLIEHGPSATSETPRIPSNAHVAEAAHGAERQLTASETTFVRQTQPANSALAELQRRSPTVSRGRAAANRDPVSGRYRRPSNSTLRPYPIVRFLGSRDGAVVRALASHQCVPGSIPGPGVICGLSLLLVLFSAPRGFSPCTPVFPSPQKPTFPNSNSSLESVPG